MKNWGCLEGFLDKTKFELWVEGLSGNETVRRGPGGDPWRGAGEQAQGSSAGAEAGICMICSRSGK